ncbi:tail fiber protein [Flagellimonas taeanensis]|nr:tail fiber protein [Allomuricauda taeanensis]
MSEIPRTTFLLLLISFTLCTNMFSQWDTNGSKIYFNNGNVGIGTTDPADKLHVSEGKIRVSDGSDRIYMRVDDMNSKSIIGFGDDFGDRLDIFFDYWNGDSSDLELMSLLSNGNVGIGTTTPDAKLTVKGRIHGEEIKVDLSVPGPDYVFREGYDLKSLEEVQNHIKEHGHLPNIPSAKEMEANGIQLGEMNMKLLEKIEELTLYVIQLKKENELMKPLQRELILQKKELEELRKLIKSLKE